MGNTSAAARVERITFPHCLLLGNQNRIRTDCDGEPFECSSRHTFEASFMCVIIQVASGPWSWNRCDILNGGGPAIECRDEADMIIRRSNIGGYGTGPRPSASIGILAWGTTAGASCKLMKCQIQNTVSHAAKFEALSTGELQNCKIKHCGRTFAVHPKATLLVQ
mmetsp:Transcript_48074/g.75070  ORF Transcript_48074/g.75070 Transcript_48074/m.75070 type:complete len:165 (-) Transcript_48074:1330-1824(-)